MQKKGGSNIFFKIKTVLLSIYSKRKIAHILTSVESTETTGESVNSF